jgi:hypothetical protein
MTLELTKEELASLYNALEYTIEGFDGDMCAATEDGYEEEMARLRKLSDTIRPMVLDEKGGE